MPHHGGMVTDDSRNPGGVAPGLGAPGQGGAVVSDDLATAGLLARGWIPPDPVAGDTQRGPTHVILTGEADGRSHTVTRGGTYPIRPHTGERVFARALRCAVLRSS
jgi:hypothetical protein